MSSTRTCPSCQIERDLESFSLTPELTEHAICDFCVELAPKTPLPEPKRRGRKAATAPLAIAQPPEITPGPEKPPERPVERTPETQAEADAAFALPYVAPKFDKAAAATDPVRELASRELARRRLLPFIQRFRPKYMPGWVHKDICRRLERFVEAVERGEEPRLLLMMPPRAGKSEIGSRHFPPWVLGKHPDWEIIAASHTGSLSLSFSRYIRDLLRDPAYASVFPDAVLDPSSQSVENWNLTSGGGYLAAGVGTGITGRGAHILLLDDLVKDQEAADSNTIRENTWEWYISTAHSRLAPGGGVLGIMTWWHEDDWAGRIQEAMKGEGEKFEIVRYPAINEEGDEYILTDDRIVEIPPNSPVPDGARMTRPHGTALHPERYTTEALKRKKLNYKAAGMIRMWNALYQQNPTPDSGIYFTKDLFRRYAHAPSRRGRTVYQAWDFAITEGEQNDYTVCATIMQDEFDNLYVIDIFRFKSDDGNAIVEHMIDQYVMWGVDYLGMEDGQIWKAIRSQFERRCQERKVYPSFEVLQPLTDKLVRANPLKGRMQLGKVYWPEDGAFPWVEICVRELIVFPNGKHDDQVDAVAWAVRMTLNHSAPRDPAPKPRGPESWKTRLAREIAGAGGGHMAS